MAAFAGTGLENLLRNARDSDEYDMDRLIDQTLGFLFSDGGSFLRDRIVSELVNSLDSFGQNTVQSITTAVQRRLGIKQDAPVAATAGPSDLDNLRRILDILKDTPGFDAAQVATRIPPLLFKPETQAMGQQVVAGLAQRALARLIRTLLLEGEPSDLPPQLTPASVQA
jgi:hypothetical protein